MAPKAQPGARDDAGPRQMSAGQGVRVRGDSLLLIVVSLRRTRDSW